MLVTRSKFLFLVPHSLVPLVDQGVRSFPCSRRGDALKVWVALQRHGADGIGALYDRLCEVTRVLHDAITRREEFEALHVPEANILCFRWIGSSPRDTAAVDGLNRELRERYDRSGGDGSRRPCSGGAVCFESQ